MYKLMCVLLLMVLQACSQEIELPVVAPLSVSDQQLSALYKYGEGPLTVKNEQLDFTASDNKVLEITVSYPQQKGHYPLLVFSHGNWSDKDKYQNIINHWVSHGYIVLAANHDDCCGMAQGIFNSVRYGQLGLIQRRVDAIQILLDSLDTLQVAVPDIRDQINLTAIAVTGHSFGAYTAQQFIGAGVFNPETEQYEYNIDERVKAVVAISPPGPMFDTITEQSWIKVDKPMLVTTGTWDSNAQFWPDWRLHKMSFDTAMEGSNYALITQGADHYLGNLICRPEREVAPQHNALVMLNTVSLAFLDAYLKADSDAHRFINTDQLKNITDGFSMLERR